MNPEERIRAYLALNKTKVSLYPSVDAVVRDVKLSVFYGMSPLSDDQIRKVVTDWAMIHAVGLLLGPQTAGGAGAGVGGAGGGVNTDSELVDAVKKAVKTVAAGVTVGRKDANVNLALTGLTANLQLGGGSAAVGISWGGTLKLETEHGPFHLTGTLSKDEWEVVLSFPQDTYIPDLSKLGKVFSEGETAIRKMAEATRGFKSLDDTRKIGALVKPHAAALEQAVEAASGIANAPKKGGASFGFKLGSPDPLPGQEGMPRGVQGSIVFTYVF